MERPAGKRKLKMLSQPMADSLMRGVCAIWLCQMNTAQEGDGYTVAILAERQNSNVKRGVRQKVCGFSPPD
jgi:hypothetical protein